MTDSSGVYIFSFKFYKRLILGWVFYIGCRGFLVGLIVAVYIGDLFDGVFFWFMFLFFVSVFWDFFLKELYRFECLF